MSPKKPNPFESLLAERSNRERTSVLLQPDPPEEHTRDQEAEGIDVERAVADRGYEETCRKRTEDLHRPVSAIDERIRCRQIARADYSRHQGEARRIEYRSADGRSKYEDIGNDEGKTKSERDRNGADEQNSSEVTRNHRSTVADGICDSAAEHSEQCIWDRSDDNSERGNQSGFCLNVADVREGNQRYRITELARDLSEPQRGEARGSKRAECRGFRAGGHRDLTRRKTIQKPPIARTTSPML